MSDEDVVFQASVFCLSDVSHGHCDLPGPSGCWQQLRRHTFTAGIGSLRSAPLGQLPCELLVGGPCRVPRQQTWLWVGKILEALLQKWLHRRRNS